MTPVKQIELNASFGKTFQYQTPHVIKDKPMHSEIDHLLQANP